MVINTCCGHLSCSGKNYQFPVINIPHISSPFLQSNLPIPFSRTLLPSSPAYIQSKNRGNYLRVVMTAIPQRNLAIFLFCQIVFFFLPSDKNKTKQIISFLIFITRDVQVYYYYIYIKFTYYNIFTDYLDGLENVNNPS